MAIFTDDQFDRMAGTVASTHSATCTITKPDPDAPDPTMDPETGLYPDPAAITVYTGPCSVRPTGGDRVQEFGEGPVVTRQYTVGITDLTAAVEPGHDVTIDTCRDPQIVDKTLVVLDVPKSELVITRQLICEEVL